MSDAPTVIGDSDDRYGDPGRRWGCKHCTWLDVQSKLLVAANPFDTTDTIVGCPQCKGIDCFWEVCDEPGCVQEATCGFPTGQGYRRTCHHHSDLKAIR
jgi:hypothetical protein